MTKTITSFPLNWYSAFLQSKLIVEQLKLETVKMMGARSKINAISLNAKINKWKSVDTCGYKLPINVLNFMQKDSAQAKISSKVVGGGYFFWLTVYIHMKIHSVTVGFLTTTLSAKVMTATSQGSRYTAKVNGQRSRVKAKLSNSCCLPEYKP